MRSTKGVCPFISQSLTFACCFYEAAVAHEPLKPLSIENIEVAPPKVGGFTLSLLDQFDID